MPTKKEILAGIAAGGKAAKEEAEKGLGIRKVAADPSVVPAGQSEAISTSPVVPEAKPEEASDSGKGEPKQARRGKRRMSASKPKSGQKSDPKNKPEKTDEPEPVSSEGSASVPMGSTGADPVAVETAAVSARPDLDSQWSAAKDSEYETRAVVPAALDETIVSSIPSNSLQEISPTSVKVEFASAVAPMQSTEDAPHLDKLRADVDKARAEFVQKEYEYNRLSEKLKRSPIGRFFKAHSDDVSDVDHCYQQYKERLAELRNAELGELRQSRLQDQELKESMAGMLQVSMMEEALALVAERDKCRLEGKGLSEKVLNVGRAIGERYNSLSKTKKIAIGITVALAAAGAGLAGGAMVGSGAIIARKFIAGAGLSVAIDAKLDKNLEERFRKQTENEISAYLYELFEAPYMKERTLEEKTKIFEKGLHAASGKATRAYDALVSRRRLNGFVGVAAGLGLSFGGSAIAKEGVEYLNEIGFTQSAKEVLFGEVPEEVSNDAMQERVGEVMKAVREYAGASPEQQLSIRNATGLTDGQLRATAKTSDLTESLEEGNKVASPGSAVEAGTSKGAASVKFEDILNAPYEVQKGDSIWKIIGARAEGLEGTQKTHFIDALKDKVGDVQLKAGESFDFKAHGLTAEAIDQAYADAQGLSPEKIASIAANDAKIAEYVSADPSTHLTDGKVDEILQGRADATVDAGGQSAGPGVDARPDFYESGNAGADAAAPGSVSVVVERGGVALKDVFTPALQPRVDDWYGQIFRVENEMPGSGHDWVFDKEKILKMPIRQIFSDVKSGARLTGLSQEQIKNLASFMQETGKATGNNGFVRDVLIAKKDATVEDFLKKVAPLVGRGQRIGLYTTSR